MIGSPIILCGTDYPNAKRAAAEMWTNSLRAAGFIEPSTTIFTLQDDCPTSASSTDRIDYVSIAKTDDDMVCGSPGCFNVVGGRSDPALGTYIGHLEILLLTTMRSTSHDSESMFPHEFSGLRHTIAHELGHVLSLEHPTAYSVVGGCHDAVMSCWPGQIPNWHGMTPWTAYPLKQYDLDEYEDIYTPRPVDTKRSLSLIANTPNQPGSVDIRFDATETRVERNVEIRLKIGSRWSDALHRYPASVEAPELMLDGQPAGSQVYGIFLTTKALVKGQARQDGKPIGFVQELPIDVTGPPEPPIRPPDPPVNKHILGTRAEPAGGGGSIQRRPNHIEYNHDQSVTLTAVWDDATHDFHGWSGDCSGTALTCSVLMDRPRNVIASFAPEGVASDSLL